MIENYRIAPKLYIGEIMPSFYTPELKEDSSNIVIRDSEFHHIIKVFRNKLGDIINLNSGEGVFASAEIINVEKKFLECKIIKFEPKRRYSPNIAVAFSLLRNKNDELIVEKLTELGVAELFPFEGEYTVRKRSKNTLSKFEITAISAIKQCDNGYLPLLNNVALLSKQLEVIEAAGYLPIIASELADNVTISSIMEESSQPLCIVIGPEGGFSEQEFELFTAKKYPQYTLGINILRAETAAICAVSQIITKLLK